MTSDIEMVQNSGFFDGVWYLEQYPDVMASGLSPAEHYHKYGWRLGRDPGPGFSTSGYLLDNPDCANKNVDPVLHFMTGGKVESRASLLKEREGVSTGNVQGDKTLLQLRETQRLLEFYYSRCQELEFKSISR